jgi:hypothetical protein
VTSSTTDGSRRSEREETHVDGDVEIVVSLQGTSRPKKFVVEVEAGMDPQRKAREIIEKGAVQSRDGSWTLYPPYQIFAVTVRKKGSAPLQRGRRVLSEGIEYGTVSAMGPKTASTQWRR